MELCNHSQPLICITELIHMLYVWFERHYVRRGTASNLNKTMVPETLLRRPRYYIEFAFKQNDGSIDTTSAEVLGRIYILNKTMQWFKRQYVQPRYFVEFTFNKTLRHFAVFSLAFLLNNNILRFVSVISEK